MAARIAHRGSQRLVVALLLLASTTAGAAPEIALEQPAGSNLVGNRVVGFGNNNVGQITVPPGLTGVIAIDAAEDSSTALKIDGSVVGWGDNTLGQANVPPSATNVVEISTGGQHVIARKADGTIVSWGVFPTDLSTLSNRAVSAGPGWSAAIKSSTAVLTWGPNAAPVPPGETGLAAIATGDFHILTLRNNGSVGAFGNNSNGQQVVPIGMGTVAAIAAGRRFSLALLPDGTVRGWGFNDNGGGGHVPVPAGLNNVVAIAAQGHALALKSDGTVVGWGRNAEGQLNLPAGTSAVRAIAAGGYHSLALAGSTLSYGSQLVGGPGLAKTFVIKNTGTLPLSITGVNVFGAQSSDFIVNTANMASSVPAGGQTSFVVNFAPTAVGARRTMLRVINNDGDESSFETLLNGTGFVAPEIVVRGDGVGIVDGDSTPSLADHTDYGEVLLGGEQTRVFTIINFGNATLTLGGVAIGGAHAADFFVSRSPDSSVAPGASTVLHVRMTPGAAGLRNAVLSFANNDGDENPFDFAIQGNAIAPRIEVRGNGVVITDGDSTPGSADHTDFGARTVSGGNIERTFVIANIGTLPLTVGAVMLTGANATDFSVVGAPASSVAPGTSTSVNIRFDPTAVGLRTAQLSFETNDTLAALFDFSIQGEGIGELPGAPAIVSATPLSGGARINFSQATDGGSPILDYTASCTPGTASNTQNALSIDVSGLTDQVAHRCSVRARNAIGTGAASASLSVIPGSSGNSTDLTISKSNGTRFVNGAAAVDYLITVTNAGPAGVVAARVQDSIGTGTDFSAATWTCTAASGAACPLVASGSGALDAEVDLPANASVQFLFSALPHADTETPISNIASVTPPAAITDPNLNNNIANDGPDLRGVFRDGLE